jgi:hypothetical protein
VFIVHVDSLGKDVDLCDRLVDTKIGGIYILSLARCYFGSEDEIVTVRAAVGG